MKNFAKTLFFNKKKLNFYKRKNTYILVKVKEPVLIVYDKGFFDLTLNTKIPGFKNKVSLNLRFEFRIDYCNVIAQLINNHIIFNVTDNIQDGKTFIVKAKCLPNEDYYE
jgi:hypothetical protein